MGTLIGRRLQAAVPGAIPGSGGEIKPESSVVKLQRSALKGETAAQRGVKFAQGSLIMIKQQFIPISSRPRKILFRREAAKRDDNERKTKEGRTNSEGR